MWIERLVLEDFRNYAAEAVDLSGGMNLLVGRNAQGKTNLLEAVYCLSGLGSPRAADGALVRDGAERALLHARVEKGTRHLDVDLEIRPGRGTRALVNKSAVPGTRSLSEVVVAVFFGPDELSLVKGSPEGRRRFLDDLIVKQRPARYGLKREWERVLKQRNALLKTWPRSNAGASSRETLDVWDEAFVRAGAALSAARLEALHSLTPYATKRYEAIAGGGRVDLTYTSAWMAEDMAQDATVSEDDLRGALGAALDQVRVRELERGVSLVGPQRDDISVRLSSLDAMLDARTYASQGDQRTIALALKLGEHDLLVEVLREEPVLLLDDVFSELDPSRRAWLADAVRDLGQTLLSSAEPGALEAAGGARVIEVSAGRLAVR